MCLALPPSSRKLPSSSSSSGSADRIVVDEQAPLPTEVLLNRPEMAASSTHAGPPSFSAQDHRPMLGLPSPATLKQVGRRFCSLLLLAVVGALFGRKHFPWTSAEVALNLAPVAGFLLAVAFLCLDLAPRSTYLVDFACYRPPKELKITKAEFIELAKQSGNFDAAAIEFQRRVLANSGIGDESYMPRWVFRPEGKATFRPRAPLVPVFPPGKAAALREGRTEASQVMFGAVDDLIADTGVRPRDIRVLVVNCGVLNTTPSLAAMLINRYKLRRDVRSYNLGGMGCAAGAAAVGLARDLLGAHPSSLGLVVSTEAVSATWYAGNELDMLVPNCFFRMGAAALLLSSRRRDWWRSKYELMQVVRTHKGGDGRSFRCVHMRQDGDLRQGLSVGRDLLEVGGEALKTHIDTLELPPAPAPQRLLPFNSLPARLQGMLRRGRCEKKRAGAPDLKSCFEHVCVAAAGERVLDEARRGLGLAEEDMEAARRTLERFGNTSSSSVWYELAYLEAEAQVGRGHRVLQLAVGSGLKCGSVAWRALRAVDRPRRSPWFEEKEEEK